MKLCRMFEEAEEEDIESVLIWTADTGSSTTPLPAGQNPAGAPGREQ